MKRHQILYSYGLLFLAVLVFMFQLLVHDNQEGILLLPVLFLYSIPVLIAIGLLFRKKTYGRFMPGVILFWLLAPLYLWFGITEGVLFAAHVLLFVLCAAAMLVLLHPDVRDAFARRKHGN